MDQDLSRNLESASAVQPSRDGATYSLTDNLPTETISTIPKIVTPIETATGHRSRRRTFRIRASGDDRRSRSSWLVRFVFLAFFASFLVHFGLVLWMAYWTFQTISKENELLLAGGEVVGIDPKLDEIRPIEIDLNASEKLLASPARQRIDLVKREILEGDIPSSILNRFGDTANSSVDIAGDLGFGDGTGGALLGGNIVRGKNAVTKGSFTTWTSPENPKVRDPYLIVIQIKLPKRIKKYRASDLSGVILGTDTWSQRIPFDPQKLVTFTYTARLDSEGKTIYEPVNRPPRDWLPIEDHTITLVIKVPGAKKAMVEDTIRIQSKLLKEKQTLKIVFGSQQ